MDDLEHEIRLRVRSGLIADDDICGQVSEVYPDASLKDIETRVLAELTSKRGEQRDWKHPTDVHLLMQAFDTLAENGVIAIHNAGWDQSDAVDRCMTAYDNVPDPAAYFGYCCYTSQDVDSAIDTDTLYIGFGATDRDEESLDKTRTAKAVVAELKRVGLTVRWNGNPSERILIKMRWRNPS